MPLAASGGGDDFAVVTIWPATRRGCRRWVLVLSGDKNDISYDLDAYTQTVVVTWAMNHEGNPAWLPALLVHLVSAMAAQPPCELVDIVAYSRGVQAFLLCLNGSAPDWLREVGNVYLIGGCLWQRQEPALPERVQRGLLSCRALAGCVHPRIRIQRPLSRIVALIPASHPRRNQISSPGGSASGGMVS